MNPWQTWQYRLLHAASRRLAARGPSGLRDLAGTCGACLWRLAPGRRALAIRAIGERLGLAPPEAGQLAKQSFVHNILSFLEIVLVPEFGFGRTDLLEPDRAVLDRMKSCDRPLVVATGHLGAWEISAGLAGDFMSDRPRLVIVRSHGNPAVRQYMFDMRGSRGARIVGHRNAVAAALKALRRGGMVGFLVDHNCSRDEAIFLPFLGRTAAVNVGPAVLAVRAEALICPLVVARQDGSYMLLLDEPLDTATLPGSYEQRIEAAARFYTGAVENRIRQFPEQWFWMHNRWKTRPPGENTGIDK
jgi:KDO2-lipid IV(A) lauroyltransferase